jgi:membrane-bound lytic murein transglycosylase A
VGIAESYSVIRLAPAASEAGADRKQRILRPDMRVFCVFWALAAMMVLASCVPKQRPEAPQPPPVEQPAPPAEAKPPTAALLGVSAGPALSAIDEAQADRALEAFRISCPALTKRTDASGLTRPEDWQEACAIAVLANMPRGSAATFFADHFELIQVGDGTAFVTGYFEPEIAGSRTRQPGFEVPIYRKPPDLVEVDAETAEAAGTPRRGRLENGVIVPYYERSEIEAGALADRGLEIAWAADEIDLFFLQIQGSGRLRLPDGGVMRIGYAGQNGREYVGIGKLMKDRGLLGPGQTTMQGIVAWLRAYPEEGKAIMRENKSYIFFQELTGAGPLGALGLPVTGRASVATDPKYVPMGAPVLLQLDRAEANGLWVAQDTGGAIKGSNRFDTFWGAGAEAARIAGGMQGRGRAYILVPKGTLARLHATPQP